MLIKNIKLLNTNGNVYISVNIINDIPVGLVEEFYENSKLRNKHYLNNIGKKNGLELFYHKNNYLWCVSNWVNGKLYGLETNYCEKNKGDINKQL